MGTFIISDFKKNTRFGDFVNWIDIGMIFILLYTISSGLRLGFIVSTFRIIKFILSIAITKRYYIYIYGYIISNPRVYNIFKGITELILKILFYSKNKEDINFIPGLISKGLLNIVINIFAIIIIFWLINILINLFLEIFSFILKAPVLKQLNRIGGIIFGLIEGLFIIYLLNMILSPIALVFPESFIGKGLSNSLIYDYLKDINLMLNLFSIEEFI